MGITLSPQDSATAFRVLAASARHPENSGQVFEERILARLPKQSALLAAPTCSGRCIQRACARSHWHTPGRW